MSQRSRTKNRDYTDTETSRTPKKTKGDREIKYVGYTIIGEPFDYDDCFKGARHIEVKVKCHHCAKITDITSKLTRVNHSVSLENGTYTSSYMFDPLDARCTGNAIVDGEDQDDGCGGRFKN